MSSQIVFIFTLCLALISADTVVDVIVVKKGYGYTLELPPLGHLQYRFISMNSNRLISVIVMDSLNFNKANSGDSYKYITKLSRSAPMTHVSLPYTYYNFQDVVPQLYLILIGEPSLSSNSFNVSLHIDYSTRDLLPRDGGIYILVGLSFFGVVVYGLCHIMGYYMANNS